MLIDVKCLNMQNYVTFSNCRLWCIHSIYIIRSNTEINLGSWPESWLRSAGFSMTTWKCNNYIYPRAYSYLNYSCPIIYSTNNTVINNAVKESAKNGISGDGKCVWLFVFSVKRSVSLWLLRLADSIIVLFLHSNDWRGFRLKVGKQIEIELCLDIHRFGKLIIFVRWACAIKIKVSGVGGEWFTPSYWKKFPCIRN